jgi:hypothetical protein
LVASDPSNTKIPDSIDWFIVPQGENDEDNPFKMNDQELWGYIMNFSQQPVHHHIE